ncbi:MAG: FHA domain-containing protein [Chloroflexota bacterium]|nr:FHA domain-containing protein [Chloroflexota bacterium]
MNRIQELLQIYMGMRAQGMEAKRALKVLRPQIDLMPQADQVELVRQVRHLEAQDDEIQNTGTQPKPIGKLDVQSKPIKPLSQTLPKLNREDLLATQKVRDANFAPTASVPPAPIQCPHCGRQNRAGEIWCVACGRTLHESDTGASTRALAATGSDDHGFFGKDSVLVLTVRDNQTRFKIRPQKQKHDIIIGRSDKSVQPDVDLGEVGGAGVGVSRMHASLHYDAHHSTLNITDMNTVNGTYLNGTKLLPNEVRVLRDGDEVRFGQMVVLVQFYIVER